ncbi:fructose-bisphosphate aldolase class I [Candidatus Peregrinibacteria bacterium CG22_combo_CG10-13_8_21_14_all_49_11]|nr:MAG: fructose-bisphosphate aldolase class I [Candidatus Peregrinibacteria bacterium CG22_combo_CG10-13_8_21_14_all_49_11]
MDTAKLSTIIQSICQPEKGILAADESSGTIKKRFDSIGIESTERSRRDYRNMLFSAPDIDRFISGVILFDETIDQKDDSGRTFAELLASRGIVPGIKSDEGKDEHPHFAPQTITRGLKGMAKRLENWTERSNGTLGFTKWRQVILVEPEPSEAFLASAMDAMAQNAAYSQAAGYVPITEPEILMDGNHTLEQCAAVTERALTMLYYKLEAHGVSIPHTLLKPNMVLSGKDRRKDTPKEVAEATLRVFRNVLPANLPGIVFLSGGQSPEQATENLNAINTLAKKDPWFVSFSYGRALQDHALKAWAGKEKNISQAQQELRTRAELNSKAQKGEYSPDMEKSAVAR